MYFSKILSGLFFFGALAFGILFAYIANGPKQVLLADVPLALSPLPLPLEPAPVDAEDMVGVWKGTWCYNRAACTITIERTNADKFYGKLRKEDAEIAIAGTLDAKTRTISFKETKVLKLGVYAGWSLGTNTGSFSLDGRSLTGTGTDKHGMYFWDASKQ